MFIVAVAGGSGSGKTTVAHAIVEALGTERVSVIQHDSYYRDRSHLPIEERGRVNYDHPDALETRMLVEHLHALRAGQIVEVPEYDFTLHTRTDRVHPVNPRPVIIVDGILILVEQALRECFDLKVFVDTDADVRILRRIERDLKERHRSLESVTEQYLGTVRPMHLEFVEPSKRHADVIVREGGYNRESVDELVERIRKSLD
jgi:uridine kinase